MTIDRAYGRGAKLTVALFLLGASTVAVAFLPGFETIGAASALLLALFRIGQGLAMGGVWDGLASLLSPNAPAGRRGWFAMNPQLGVPLGLVMASGLFAHFIANLSPDDFFSQGWRTPVFVPLPLKVYAPFARRRD